MDYYNDLAKTDIFYDRTGRSHRRGSSQKKPPEDELRVPPLPKTADTPTYQTTIGGWSSKPVGANTIRPTDTTQAQKKQAIITRNDAPTPSPVSRSKTWEGGTARAVPDEGGYKSSTTTRTGFTGGGRTLSDETPTYDKYERAVRRVRDMPYDEPQLEPEEPRFSLGTYAKNFGQSALDGLNKTFYGVGSALEDFIIAPIAEFGGDIAQATAIAAGADPQGEWGKTAADAVRWMHREKEKTDRHQEAVQQEAEENIGRIKNDTLRSVAAFGQNDIAPSSLTTALQAAMAPFTGGTSLMPSTQSLTQAAYLAKNPSVLNKVTTWLSGKLGNPNFWAAFAQEYVGEYDNAVKDGVPSEKAALISTYTGLMDALVEVSGGYQSLPDDVQDIAWLDGKRGLRLWLKGILNEGHEELVQGIINRTAQKVGYRNGSPLFSTTDGTAIVNPARMVKEFLSGAALAAMLYPAETALNSTVNGSQYANVLPPSDTEINTQSDTALANAGAVGYTETDTVQEDIKSRYSYNYSGTPEHIVDIASTLPPAYENMLTNGWKDISVPEEAASGHYRLVESATGLQIRFDRKVEGAPGFHGKDHYHILNPNATGNKDYYLDQNGNILRKTDTRSHILPKEN